MSYIFPTLIPAPFVPSNFTFSFQEISSPKEDNENNGDGLPPYPTKNLSVNNLQDQFLSKLQQINRINQKGDWTFLCPPPPQTLPAKGIKSLFSWITEAQAQNVLLEFVMNAILEKMEKNAIRWQRISICGEALRTLLGKWSYYNFAFSHHDPSFVSFFPVEYWRTLPENRCEMHIYYNSKNKNLSLEDLKRNLILKYGLECDIDQGVLFCKFLTNNEQVLFKVIDTSIADFQEEFISVNLSLSKPPSVFFNQKVINPWQFLTDEICNIPYADSLPVYLHEVTKGKGELNPQTERDLLFLFQNELLSLESNPAKREDYQVKREIEHNEDNKKNLETFFINYLFETNLQDPDVIFLLSLQWGITLKLNNQEMLPLLERVDTICSPLLQDIYTLITENVLSWTAIQSLLQLAAWSYFFTKEDQSSPFSFTLSRREGGFSCRLSISDSNYSILFPFCPTLAALTLSQELRKKKYEYEEKNPLISLYQQLFIFQESYIPEFIEFPWEELSQNIERLLEQEDPLLIHLGMTLACTFCQNKKILQEQETLLKLPKVLSLPLKWDFQRNFMKKIGFSCPELANLVNRISEKEDINNLNRVSITILEWLIENKKGKEAHSFFLESTRKHSSIRDELTLELLSLLISLRRLDSASHLLSLLGKERISFDELFNRANQAEKHLIFNTHSPENKIQIYHFGQTVLSLFHNVCSPLSPLSFLGPLIYQLLKQEQTVLAFSLWKEGVEKKYFSDPTLIVSLGDKLLSATLNNYSKNLILAGKICKICIDENIWEKNDQTSLRVLSVLEALSNEEGEKEKKLFEKGFTYLGQHLVDKPLFWKRFFSLQEIYLDRFFKDSPSSSSLNAIWKVLENEWSLLENIGENKKQETSVIVSLLKELETVISEENKDLALKILTDRRAASLLYSDLSAYASLCLFWLQQKESSPKDKETLLKCLLTVPMLFSFKKEQHLMLAQHLFELGDNQNLKESIQHVHGPLLYEWSSLKLTQEVSHLTLLLKTLMKEEDWDDEIAQILIESFAKNPSVELLFLCKEHAHKGSVHEQEMLLKAITLFAIASFERKENEIGKKSVQTLVELEKNTRVYSEETQKLQYRLVYSLLKYTQDVKMSKALLSNIKEVTSSLSESLSLILEKILEIHWKKKEYFEGLMWFKEKNALYIFSESYQLEWKNKFFCELSFEEAVLFLEKYPRENISFWSTTFRNLFKAQTSPANRALQKQLSKAWIELEKEDHSREMDVSLRKLCWQKLLKNSNYFVIRNHIEIISHIIKEFNDSKLYYFALKAYFDSFKKNHREDVKKSTLTALFDLRLSFNLETFAIYTSGGVTAISRGIDLPLINFTLSKAIFPNIECIKGALKLFQEGIKNPSNKEFLKQLTPLLLLVKEKGDASLIQKAIHLVASIKDAKEINPQELMPLMRFFADRLHELRNPSKKVVWAPKEKNTNDSFPTFKKSATLAYEVTADFYLKWITSYQKKGPLSKQQTEELSQQIEKASSLASFELFEKILLKGEEKRLLTQKNLPSLWKTVLNKWLTQACVENGSSLDTLCIPINCFLKQNYRIRPFQVEFFTCFNLALECNLNALHTHHNLPRFKSYLKEFSKFGEHFSILFPGEHTSIKISKRANTKDEIELNSFDLAIAGRLLKTLQQEYFTDKQEIKEIYDFANQIISPLNVPTNETEIKQSIPIFQLYWEVTLKNFATLSTIWLCINSFNILNANSYFPVPSLAHSTYLNLMKHLAKACHSTVLTEENLLNIINIVGPVALNMSNQNPSNQPLSKDLAKQLICFNLDIAFSYATNILLQHSVLSSNASVLLSFQKILELFAEVSPHKLSNEKEQKMRAEFLIMLTIQLHEKTLKSEYGEALFKILDRTLKNTEIFVGQEVAYASITQSLNHGS